MKTAIAIRQVAYEDLGILSNLLPDFGYQIRYIEAGMDSIDKSAMQSADLLMMLGGPISVNDDSDYPFLGDLLSPIATRIKAGQPTLGICLGAQLIARTLGAPIYPMAQKEIGWSELTLTSQGQSSCLRHLADCPVLHWHGETFDMPPGVEHLAQTDVCRNQAFALGRHLLALQFHPEVTERGLERWYIGHTVELAQAGVSIPALRQQAAKHTPQLLDRTHKCFVEWLKNL